jgi:hypothetical protein
LRTIGNNTDPITVKAGDVVLIAIGLAV